jgi:hypothetical protein
MAGLCAALRWKGGSASLDSALAEGVDRLVVYGGDSTVVAWNRLTRGRVRVVGYGHRVSLGLVLVGADMEAAAVGLAMDVRMYDQGGCLSPQAIFVEGDPLRARRFGLLLAEQMRMCQLGEPHRTMARSARVREARDMASFDTGAAVMGDDALDWTVIVRETSNWPTRAGDSVVSIVPFELTNLTAILDGKAGLWQGAAVAMSNSADRSAVRELLSRSGFSYICEPGYIQTPGISWRENNLDVLASLII